MLSRVAENIYWMARYVERAENTARIIGVSANLLLDLPRGIAPGWEPLIWITGSNDMFHERYGDSSERQVLKFLVGDHQNPSSILPRSMAPGRTPEPSATSCRARHGSRSTSFI